ncbi:MAG: primosomal protein N', partial [Clostridia bacterium]|nr:primosomal protein N' [Clostridia bacterium]
MMSVLVARAAVDKTLYNFDMLFDYVVPDYLKRRIAVGKRLLVPFGNGNKKRQAMVMELFTEDTPNPKLKNVAAVLDDYPLLTTEMIKLVHSMKERCYCTYYDVIRAMLPVGINYRIASAYKLNDNIHLENPTYEQRDILSFFTNKSKSIKQESLFK